MGSGDSNPVGPDYYRGNGTDGDAQYTGHGFVHDANSPEGLEDQRKLNEANANAINNRTFGGQGGGDQAYQERYRGIGNQIQQNGVNAQQRQGVHVDYSQANAAAGNQAEMYQAMRNRALGLTPSVAQMYGDRQMQQAAAAQSSAAASARGPGALAMAQQNSAANTAAAQSNIAQSAQIAGVQERQQAEQNAFGAATGMRGQSAQQSQYQAGLAAQQRGLNDQFQLGSQGLGFNYEKLGYDVANKQADMNIANRGLDLGQTNADINSRRQQSDETQGYFNIFSDEDAKTNIEPVTPTDDYAKEAADAAAGIKAVKSGGGMMGTAMKMAMLSDERAKDNVKPSYSALYRAITSPTSGSDPRGAVDLGTVADIRQRAAEEQPTQRIDLPRLESRGSGGVEAAQPARRSLSGVVGSSHRKPTLEEQAAALGAEVAARNTALQASPVAVRDREPMANALQSLQPYAYDYKPGMGPPGKNVGPMANSMAQDPIASTAVQRDPETGLLAIDRDRALKLSLGAAGYLGKKQEEQDARIGALSRAIGGRR